MRAVSSAELLNAWEYGLDGQPERAALKLLAAACPELADAEPAMLSIGQRDARLLALRELTFGPQLTAIADCPRCGERLELSFAVAAIRPSALPEPAEELDLAVGDYTLRFRLPTSQDLTALAGVNELAEAQRTLLNRCVLALRHGEAPLPAGQLPAEIAAQVAARMAEADPCADIQLALACPTCGHAWQAPFDIVSFLWIELDAWARRTLREMHQLALAYGWREADILALSPRRRQWYLEQIGI